MTDEGTPTERWAALDRGWKAVVLGLVLTVVVRFLHVAPPPFGW